MATTKLVRKSEVPCPCGCGKQHMRIVGEIHWEDVGRWQYYFAMLAQHDEERHAWFALGGAPNDVDARDGYVSVESWSDGDNVISRITDASESPHRAEPMFVDNVGRLVDRAEVFPREDVRAWVFASIDDIVANDPDVRAFLVEG